MLENPWWKQSYGNRSDGENTKLLTLSLLEVGTTETATSRRYGQMVAERRSAAGEGRREKIIYIFIKKKESVRAKVSSLS